MDIKTRLLPYQEHLNEIKEALFNKDAYLFVGAGLSLNAKPKTSNVQNSFQTWTAFMEQLANRLWPNLDERGVERRVLGNHLYIAQLYEEEFGTSSFYKELLKSVPYKNYEPSETHLDLIGLDGWKGFITTNQDCLIEQALDQLHLYHDIIISDLDVATKPAKRKVFKLHGSMERPESIIFTEEQYRTYEQSHPLLHVKVKSIFAEHCVVFVGFSLTDVNFKAIYGWVKDVLQSDYQRKAYAFVSEEDIDSYTKRYWEKRNIILLPIFTKEYRSNGSAFEHNLKAYIHELKYRQVDRIPADMDSVVYELLGLERWSVQDTKNLVHLLQQSPVGLDHRFADSFLKFYSKHAVGLEPQELIELLETIFQKQLLSPLLVIEGETLIDRLINLAESIPTEEGQAHYFLLEKSNELLRNGSFERAEQVVKEGLEKEGQPIDVRNSLIYNLIIIEKYRMNFKEIHSLIAQLQIDWEEPDWLNRLASVHLLLGNKSMGKSLYNRAIQVAEEKSDDWNLYLANLSKLYLMGDIWDADSVLEEDREETRMTVRRLFQRLKETGHPTFERWQQFDDLRSEWWSGYKNWKAQLGASQKGFNSSKGQSYQQVNEMIYFHEMNGLPHFSMTGKKFDIILDIFIENKERVKGTSLAIMFGHSKQIEHAYRFDFLTDIETVDRSALLKLSICYAKNMIWYIQSLQRDSYFQFISGWLPALIQLLNQMVPISNDEEIEEVADICFEIIREVQTRPWLDTFANSQEKLIKTIGQCLYYRPSSIRKEKAIGVLKDSIEKFRLVNVFVNFDWNSFEKESISDELINMTAEHHDYSYGILLNEWLEYGILTENQKNIVFQKVYDSEIESDQLKKIKLLLLKFFKSKLNDTDVQIIINFGIDLFMSSYSSSSGRELFQLNEHVDTMNKSQINLILEGIKNKLHTGKRNILSNKDELVNYQLHFLHKLWKIGKLEENKLQVALSEASYLEMSSASLVAEFAQDDLLTEVLTTKLLDCSYSYQVHIRKANQLIIGFWLKRRFLLGEVENRLLERLLIGLEDSNVEIASQSIRGLAFILKDNPSIISKAQLKSIIQVTRRGRDRNEIRYLTNLAFLYKELSKCESLPQTEAETVTDVINSLTSSNYSNVRLEL